MKDGKLSEGHVHMGKPNMLLEMIQADSEGTDDVPSPLNLVLFSMSMWFTHSVF